MFKSVDAGASWTPIGLEQTKHIGAIAVDPRDSKRVLVAALGHLFGPNAERGVYLSKDGGASWQRSLFVSEDAGAVDLAVDPKDPDIVFAATWQVRYRSWMSYFDPDIGPGSGVFKSTDGGEHWQRVEGGGWPAGTLGRIGLAATHTAQGTRVYATVDADDVGGLYRSDDSGAHWQRVNDDGELSSNYFARLTAMPGDPDVVFVMGRSIHRCDRGGTRCEITKGSPGGDDYHDLWINPLHPQRMITGVDQGTVVSVDGGETWSSWYNQPTGQLYHLAADNQFPYWVYAGQQDNGTVAIASRTDYGAITSRDWHPVGGDERDYDVPDPRDPNIVYGSGLGGRLSRWNARNGEVQNISPWPVSTYGAKPTTAKYRYSWITPIAVSGVAPYPLYQGAQVLFRSLDQGEHWQVISPDVAPATDPGAECESSKQPERVRECGYGVIWSIGLSPRDNDELWLGTDDGRVHASRDAGAHWQDLTPPDLPHWAKISSIDVSAIAPGTVYIAVDNHRADDFRPMAWRTHDYGKTWTAIASGLPPGHFIGALRADTRRGGLLFAGTDRGVWVSFDDGGHWQSLQRNLPSAIVTDLLVHGDDLIVATQGRSIWLLDQLAPLRQVDAVVLARPLHLFQPGVATRVRGNQNKDTPLPREEPAGRNPIDGAAIDYWLGAGAKGRLRLCILDGQGAQVAAFDGGEAERERELPAERYFEARWLGEPQRLEDGVGAHRFTWNLRRPRPESVGYEYSIAAVDGDELPLLPQGSLVAPGRYTVVLSVGNRESRASLDVVADPRVPVDAAAIASATELSMRTGEAMARQYVADGELKAVSKQLKALSTKSELAPALAAALKDADAALAPLRDGSGEQAPLNLSAIGGQLATLETDLEGSDAMPTAAQAEVYADYSARLDRALAAWSAFKAGPLPRLDAALRAGMLPAISIPDREHLPPPDPGVSREMP
jgi:photosystem II stability/assembly factor-like uncharacterized protein